MNTTFNESELADRFRALYNARPVTIASSPGRLEVLGNHTDYNAGLTVSCAVGFRCYAALMPLEKPVVKLVSTAFEQSPETFPIDQSSAPKGHWANYVLGLVAALQERGYDVPGFALLVDSAVPRSAGMSSSAAMEMAVLTGLLALMDLLLPPIDRARIGQSAESSTVGAQTGLLDQLSSLLGQRDHLLLTDFNSLQTKTIAIPAGWCFVAVDSGVKHDLTAEYNDRRASCEAAARALGVATLRKADGQILEAHKTSMSDTHYRCAAHILGEIRRVKEAAEVLASGDVNRLGTLMFISHESSRDNFRNSCPQLDELVAFAQADGRCVGARLSGGGFGGITIHLVKQKDAEAYRADISRAFETPGLGDRWSAVCEIDQGALLHAV